ncbi:hypothetical protein D3C78_1871080 [compost metagenome]
MGRDGRVLRLLGRHVCAGPAFQINSSAQQGTDQDEESGPPSTDPHWPENISGRIRNLWWLSQDLDGAKNPDQREVAYG